MGSLPFTKKVSPVIMKVLLLAATLAIASAAFDPSCEECNQAAAGLLTRLTSAACEAAFVQWWGDMTNCLYPAFIGAGDACERLGLCKVKSFLGDWTCDDCTAIMTRVADFMQQPETIQQGVGILTGECFCGAEGLTDECAGLVAT